MSYWIQHGLKLRIEAKELYLGKRIEDLRKLGEKVIHRTQPNFRCIATLPKMFQEAEKALIDGDEERSYVLFFRTAGLYLRLKNNKETDHKYLELMLPGTQFRKCIEMTNNLETSSKKALP